MKANYDWEAHCLSLGVTSEELLKVAEQEGFPMHQLSTRQSEKLLRALRKYAKQKDSEAIAQGSLF